jgi:shikimate kinase
MSVAQIFDEKGKRNFRQLEREHLKRLSELPSGIVALGGGAISILKIESLLIKREPWCGWIHR